MLTEIKNAADMLKLPFYVRAALDFRVVSSMRKQAAIEKASRKQLIQTAARRAVEEGEISLNLAIELLQANHAYGPKGKKALEGLI